MSSAAKPALARPETMEFDDKAPIEHRALRRALAGFLFSGVLLSFLGAILPAWQAHLTLDFTVVGKYFLAFGLGIVFGIRPARLLAGAKGSAVALAAGCACAAGAFALLAFVPPPSPSLWRLAGLFAAGFATAHVNTGLFYALRPSYSRDRAATVNLAGALFGIGCLLMALFAAIAFDIMSGRAMLGVLALVSAGFAALYSRTKLAAERSSRTKAARSRELKSPLALLLGLVLLFQIANEWSIAGWLPIYLIRRLGSSPAGSLLALALFWAALLGGRFAAQAVLPHANHWRLLIGSVLAELLGFLLLSMTNNLFGASVGIVCMAAGFALIYPLAAKKAGGRLGEERRPDFFSGTFTFSFAGALLAPWMLGYAAQAWGIAAVMAWPLTGAVIVFGLMLAILTESFLSSNHAAA